MFPHGGRGILGQMGDARPQRAGLNKQAPDQLQDYILGKEIGRGGFGELRGGRAFFRAAVVAANAARPGRAQTLTARTPPARRRCV